MAHSLALRGSPKNYLIIFKRRVMGFLYPPPVQAPRPPWKEGQFFPLSSPNIGLLEIKQNLGL
jgi:hypothetical protein